MCNSQQDWDGDERLFIQSIESECCKKKSNNLCEDVCRCRWLIARLKTEHDVVASRRENFRMTNILIAEIPTILKQKWRKKNPWKLRQLASYLNRLEVSFLHSSRRLPSLSHSQHTISFTCTFEILFCKLRWTGSKDDGAQFVAALQNSSREKFSAKNPVCSIYALDSSSFRLFLLYL